MTTDDDLPQDHRDRILAHLDGRLSDAEFAELEAELAASSTVRRDYVRLALLDAELRESTQGSPEQDSGITTFDSPRVTDFRKNAARWFLRAAVIAILAVPATFWLSQQIGGEGTDDREIRSPIPEAPARGIAVITAEAEAEWASTPGERPNGEGRTLEPGVLILEYGLAQIDFFGGASISLSGPAEIELIDANTAILRKGKLRADVPPAARGFEIRTADTRIEDLGTSFGLSVASNQKADLVVFDGEVLAFDQEGKSHPVLGGEGARLDAGTVHPQAAEVAGSFPDIRDVFIGSDNLHETRYADWREASLDLRRDSRLIAYYDFENLSPVSRRLRNRTPKNDASELDGGIVGARVTEGRWPGKTALDFRRQGDRVRFDIPGEWEALTLFAWVRIDALDRNLNSLFLTDYFDPNEIHWQISRLGCLHFAVSPKGVEDIPTHNRRFYSEPFWTPEKSGQWFHLATTVDRSEGGTGVTHYINGRPVDFSGGTNREKPLPRLRIGGADLGNWSDPIWPDAAIRTLNGRIDEFAIFGSALGAPEIERLYDQGRP